MMTDDTIKDMLMEQVDFWADGLRSTVESVNDGKLVDDARKLLEQVVIAAKEAIVQYDLRKWPDENISTGNQEVLPDL